MIKTIKFNWQYIFAKSNKIATIFFSIWGFVTLVTPTNGILDFIKNGLLRIVTAVLILVTIYVLIVIFVSAYSQKKRKIKVLDLHSNHSLYVEYGDLFNRDEFDGRIIIAFAGNRCFDTIVDDDLVGTSKIHGIALKRIYENKDRNQDTVNEEIQRNLSIHGYKYEKLDYREKRSGNLNRYEIGAVAEIEGLKNERYFILGLTCFDKRLRAHVEKNEYIKAISSLVKYISDRSQGFTTYMPVIGAGGADVGRVNDLIVFIIKTIEMYKNEIDCDIHIVVSENEEKLGLLNLTML